MKNGIKSEPNVAIRSLLGNDDVLDIINDFTLGLLNQNSVEDVLENVIENVIAKLGFVDCVVYLLNKQENILIQKAAYGFKDLGERKITDPIVLELKDGIVGRAARTKQAQVIDDTSKDLAYIVDDQTRLSEIAVPLIYNNELIGVIDSEHPTKGFFTAQDLKLLTTVASMAAVKIIQARYVDALKARKSQLDLIHDNTNDLIFLVNVDDTDTFRYLSVNNSYQKVTGRTPEEIIGKTIGSLWDDENRKFVISKFKEVVKTKKMVTYQMEVDSKNGMLQIESKINPVFDDKGNCIKIAGVARNVTELINKERTLRETKDQYEILFESSPDAIMIHNFKEIVDVNKAFLKQFKYDDKEDIIGKPAVTSVVHPEDIDLLNEKRKEIAVGSAVLIPSIRLIRKDESFFISESRVSRIMIKGKPHLQIITRDITERKKVEKSLQKNRERLKIATGLVQFGSFEWNFLQRDLYWDMELHKLFGLKVSSKIGRIKHFHKVLHPDDRENFLKEFSRISNPRNKANMFGVDFRVIDRLGGIKFLKCYCMIFRDPEGLVERIVGACLNVTEQHLAEQEKTNLLETLKKSEDKFRSLFESARDPILLMDKKKKFIDCNNATLRMLGFRDKKEIIGQSLNTFSPKLQPDGLLSDQKEEVMKRIALTRGSNQFEWALSKKDASQITIDISLSKILMEEAPILLMHWRDITKTRESQVALKKSEKRLRQIIDLVPHFIFAKNINGEFILVNKATAKIYNCSAKELIGKTDADFNPNKVEVEHFRRMDLEVINTNKWKPNIEELITDSEGNEKILSTTKIPFTTSDSSAPAVLGISVDITENIKKQERLEELLQVTSDQNARLQNFAHIVSHDIRSHSANISSLVNFVNKTDSEIEKKILLGMLNTSTAKLDETIHNLNEIITVNKKLNLPMERRNLRMGIKNTLQILNAEIIESNTQISIDIPAKAYVKVVPAYFDSVLLNVISNSIKYRDKSRETQLSISCKKEGEFTILNIKDNGIGIDLEKNKDKIFGMYKTFHDNEDARGFGLYITKTQIEAMKGKIEVESEVKVGSTFKIYFNEKP